MNSPSCLHFLVGAGIESLVVVGNDDGPFGQLCNAIYAGAGHAIILIWWPIDALSVETGTCMDG